MYLFSEPKVEYIYKTVEVPAIDYEIFSITENKYNQTFEPTYYSIEEYKRQCLLHSGAYTVEDYGVVNLDLENCYYKDDIEVYVFNVRNTDMCCYCEVKDGNIIFISSVTNRYGSSYPCVYFKQGVPSNSKQIYDTLLEDWGYVEGTTDYTEGNKFILEADGEKYTIRL
jgi:hypothetical protein